MMKLMTYESLNLSIETRCEQLVELQLKQRMCLIPDKIGPVNFYLPFIFVRAYGLGVIMKKVIVSYELVTTCSVQLCLSNLYSDCSCRLKKTTLKSSLAHQRSAFENSVIQWHRNFRNKMMNLCSKFIV